MNMKNEMEILQKRLPEDAIFLIDEFLGIRKRRNGRYMCQIPQKDPRYALLLTLPTKTIHQNCEFIRNDGQTQRSINYFVATVHFTRDASTSFQASNRPGYSIMELCTKMSHKDNKNINIVYDIYKYDEVRSRDMLQWSGDLLTDTAPSFYSFVREK